MMIQDFEIAPTFASYAAIGDRAESLGIETTRAYPGCQFTVAALEPPIVDNEVLWTHVAFVADPHTHGVRTVWAGESDDEHRWCASRETTGETTTALGAPDTDPWIVALAPQRFSDDTEGWFPGT